MISNVPLITKRRVLRHSVFLGWAGEDFEGDSRNLAGMFLHNSVLIAWCVEMQRPSPLHLGQIFQPRRLMVTWSGGIADGRTNQQVLINDVRRCSVVASKMTMGGK